MRFENKSNRWPWTLGISTQRQSANELRAIVKSVKKKLFLPVFVVVVLSNEETRRSESNNNHIVRDTVCYCFREGEDATHRSLCRRPRLTLGASCLRWGRIHRS